MKLGSAFSFGRRTLIAGVAAALAVFACGGPEASAETISITITTGSGTIDVGAFILSGATPTNYGTVDINALNGALQSAGSAYEFSSLGGLSNWPGAPTGGGLDLTGGVTNVRAGDTMLIINETEDGFTSPSGPSGVLRSSSTGNFRNYGAADTHTASSDYNAINTTTYAVVPNAPGTPNPQDRGGNASAAIPTFVTPYTLSNTINITLTTRGASDSFGVSAVAVAVPEPASFVTLSLGLPLSFVAVAWRRRRARAVAHTA